MIFGWVPEDVKEGVPMVAVMIGIDPHKASHTAVAIDPAEVPLGQLQVRARAAQAELCVPRISSMALTSRVAVSAGHP
jgi:hypothetical protein